jgi:hypothetical protein
LALPLLLAACAGAATAPAVPAPDARRAEAAAAVRAITAERMAGRIADLAADSMRGRDTPSPELEQAAVYLSHWFREFGLEPAGDQGSFLARWTYRTTVLRPEDTSVRLRGRPASAPRYGIEYFVIPGTGAQAEGPAWYAGPADSPGALPAEARGAVVLYSVAGAEMDAAWQQQVGGVIGPAIQAGAAAIGVILDPAFPAEAVAQLAPMTAGQQAPVPIFGLTRRGADAMFAPLGVRLETARPGARLGNEVIEIRTARTQEEHRPPNVVGMLRGSDPQLSNSYIVLTAHFDHVGVGPPDATGDSIYNGADDNASGTSALIEIARAFSMLPERPARSVVFLAVSGEEKGLLGSMAWVRNPTVPREGIIANINMDMISRNAPDTVIAIGQEYSTFEQILERVLADHPEVGLTVIRDPYPEERLFFRSDQLSFIRQNIPALFLFTGLHEDYHRPSDRPERSDPGKAARVAQLAFLVAHRIANDPVAPDWTEEGRRQVQQIMQGF